MKKKKKKKGKEKKRKKRNKNTSCDIEKHWLKNQINKINKNKT